MNVVLKQVKKSVLKCHIYDKHAWKKDYNNEEIDLTVDSRVKWPVPSQKKQKVWSSVEQCGAVWSSVEQNLFYIFS